MMVAHIARLDAGTGRPTLDDVPGQWRSQTSPGARQAYRLTGARSRHVLRSTCSGRQRMYPRPRQTLAVFTTVDSVYLSNDEAALTRQQPRTVGLSELPPI
jgi:hypothetical protein